MKEVIISDHARFEMERRQIEASMAQEVALEPQQVIEVGKGRRVHQSRYHDPVEAKEMLLRLVIEPGEKGLRVVTAYKTSRIDKYWRREART